MIAVYTLLEDGQHRTNAGFNNPKELARMLALSVHYSRKQFDSVELVANSYGIELVKKFGIEFDNIFEIPQTVEAIIPAELWALAKIGAYAHYVGKGVAFCHIDNDVILFEPIPEDVKNAPLFFQNKELLATHSHYDNNLQVMEGAEVKPNLGGNKPKFAYNCGVVGVNEAGFELVEAWCDSVSKYVFSEKNKAYWKTVTDLHSQNHLFEQYFVSAFIAQVPELELQVKVLLEDFSYSSIYTNNLPFKMVHLWGETKRYPELMEKVRARLENEAPANYQRIEAAELSHTNLFTSVYKENTWLVGSGCGSLPEATNEYREFLQNFIKKNRVHKIVDLGCGDWQFSRLMDWSNLNYTGVDCVQSVVNKVRAEFETKSIKFKYADIFNYDIPECDLLIIKDVFIHWRESEIQSFLSKHIPAKYILITNDNIAENVDITEAGQFRGVDLTKAPYNVKAEIAFAWETQYNKHTHLITNIK